MLCAVASQPTRAPHTDASFRANAQTREGLAAQEALCEASLMQRKPKSSVAPGKQAIPLALGEYSVRRGLRVLTVPRASQHSNDSSQPFD
jgi:hypothetical protein